jgi:Xaa-Pro aminopeptidase
VSATAATVASSALDIAAIQSALKVDGLDAWLLYDFRGMNPIAGELTGVAHRGGHLATRRWFYLIPAHSEPQALVHAIEPDTLAHLPGQSERYAGREQLEAGLKRMLAQVHRVAMEYSPECAIPYISRVDAGTVQLLSRFNVEIVSSGDLIQRFVAVWSEAQTATHVAASEKLHTIKDRAFETIRRRLHDGVSTSEYEIQRLMARWFVDEGLVSDADPNVSAAVNSGNPHYLPTADASRTIGPEELVLLDLWGKLNVPGSVYADITWVAYTGTHVPDRFARAFKAVVDARDAAIALIQSATRAGRDLRGWQVDRAASSVLKDAGYAPNILHRTGHSLGESVHGNGVNMDDYETHDDRRVLPGTGLTIEPGVYFDDFGVRSEINMVVAPRDARVTGPLQTAILTLA